LRLSSACCRRNIAKDKFRSFEKLTPFGVAYRYPAEDEWEIPSAEAIETWRKEIEIVRSMF